MVCCQLLLLVLAVSATPISKPFHALVEDGHSTGQSCTGANQIWSNSWNQCVCGTGTGWTAGFGSPCGVCASGTRPNSFFYCDLPAPNCDGARVWSQANGYCACVSPFGWKYGPGGPCGTCQPGYASNPAGYCIPDAPAAADPTPGVYYEISIIIQNEYISDISNLDISSTSGVNCGSGTNKVVTSTNPFSNWRLFPAPGNPGLSGQCVKYGDVFSLSNGQGYLQTCGNSGCTAGAAGVQISPSFGNSGYWRIIGGTFGQCVPKYQYVYIQNNLNYQYLDVCGGTTEHWNVQTFSSPNRDGLSATWTFQPYNPFLVVPPVPPQPVDPPTDFTPAVDTFTTLPVDTKYCWKHTYTRTPSFPACPSNKEYQDGLCYTPCAANYTGGGPLCLLTCRPGYSSHPLTCYKSIGDWYGKKSYGRGVGTIPNSCAGHLDAGLCYPRCDNGMAGIAFVCWSVCGGSLSNDCGAACSDNTQTCIHKTFDQVKSVFALFGKVAALIATMGASASWTAGEAAATSIAAENVYQVFYGFAVRAVVAGASRSDFVRLASNLARTEANQIEKSQYSMMYDFARESYSTTQSDETPEMDAKLLAALDPTGLAHVVLAFMAKTCTVYPDVRPQCPNQNMGLGCDNCCERQTTQANCDGHYADYTNMQPAGNYACAWDSVTNSCGYSYQCWF